MRTLSLFITCKPSSKPCVLKLGRPGLEFHWAAVLWHMRTDQLFMNLSFLISTFTWFLPHLTSWTGRWGHINNNDTYFLGNHPLQLTEDVGSPVNSPPSRMSRCVPNDFHSHHGGPCSSSTLHQGSDLFSSFLSSERALLLPLLWRQTGKDTELRITRYYPDWRFCLALRAGNLCKASLEMWVSSNRLSKNHLVRC